jgi:AraC family transcriptional regulator
MNIEIIERPAMRAACVRHVGPYDQIGSAFAKLGALAGPAGLFAHPGAMMIGLYYDTPGETPPEKLRADAAVVIPEGVPLPVGMTEERVDAGRFASTLHLGPYEGLSSAWRQLVEWALKSGHQFRFGPSVEIYLNNPTEVPKEQLRTQLLAPIV